MTFDQDSKEIQNSLHASLSALVLRRDLNIPDDTISVHSTISSTSATTIGSRSSPPPPAQELGIPLEIRAWVEHANSTRKSNEDWRLKAHKILRYFIETGTTFGLTDTPYVQMLQAAAEACERGSRPKAAARLTRAEKTSQKTRGTAPSHAATLGAFVINEIPIFNIFEAICWIYSCAVDVDSILTDRDVELHLYQLRCIFAALKKTSWWAPDSLPSTIAAAWSKPDGNPILVAFACTCVGSNKNDLQAARRDYVRGLSALVENCRDEKSPVNNYGNCPEFVTWGAICREERQYRSLCLNLISNHSYKCCSHCMVLKKAAWEGLKIEVEDWYAKTWLAQGDELKSRLGYIAKRLKPEGVIVKKVESIGSQMVVDS